MKTSPHPSVGDPVSGMQPHDFTNIKNTGKVLATDSHVKTCKEEERRERRCNKYKRLIRERRGGGRERESKSCRAVMEVRTISMMPGVQPRGSSVNETDSSS